MAGIVEASLQPPFQVISSLGTRDEDGLRDGYLNHPTGIEEKVCSSNVGGDGQDLRGYLARPSARSGLDGCLVK